MDYRMIKDKGKYKIVENKTNHVVFESNQHEETVKQGNHWNKGGGFAGWTPSFILKKISLTYNLAET